MPSIKDNRGYNQAFKPSKAMEIRTERRCNYILSRMKLHDKTDILELGCGTGELAYLMASKTHQEVLGIDICAPFIEQAKKDHPLPNLDFKKLDFNDPAGISNAINGKKFDYIVGNGILHHLYYNLDSALKNISALLKTHGKIIFLEPNIINPYCFLIFNFPLFRKLANLEPGEKAFTKAFIVRKLSASGFNDIRVEYKDFLLPIAPSFLITPSIIIGDIAEKIPFINKMAQSIYISAVKA